MSDARRMPLPEDPPPLAPGPAAEAREALPDEELRAMLRWMVLQRNLEDRIVRLYRQGRIVGGVFTGLGHEAMGVGAAVHLGGDDVVFPSHRDLGAYLVKGMEPATVLAQYLGRVDGPTRGRDANLHMGRWDLGIGSFISHMADTVPVAAGVAFAFRYRGEPRVALCFTGDGASSRGDWHEGINLAAVQRLPVVYVTVNNAFAYSTPLERQMAVERVSERAAGYGIPGETVDGNDVLAVWSSSRRALRRARDGGGPTLLEYRTWRLTGHSEADSADYVPPAFLEAGRRHDPIARYRSWLGEEGLLDGAGFGALEAEVEAEIDAALERAEASPEPESAELPMGVYAGTWPGGTP